MRMSAGQVTVVGRSVNRLGLSLAGLRATGMWGEPSERSALVRVIGRAVELGVDLIEVPLPFGPWADLLREADPEGVTIVARLAGRVHDAGAGLRRLGPRLPVAMVLAEPQHLEDARGWGVGAVGVVVGAGAVPSAFAAYGDLGAVRGPFPGPRRVLEWCEREQVPYLADDERILTSGAVTVALPAPRSRSDVERIYRR